MSYESKKLDTQQKQQEQQNNKDNPTNKPAVAAPVVKHAKLVEFYNQLSPEEKMKLDIVYVEAIIKQIPKYNLVDYISRSIGIQINLKILKRLEVNHKNDTREWFKYMANDAIAYIQSYRQVIDEMNQYKRELWVLSANNKTPAAVKMACIRELHAISKTSVLLLRELPFIHNLHNYYDPSYQQKKNNNNNTNNNNKQQQPIPSLLTNQSSPSSSLDNLSERRRESGLYTDYSKKREKEDIFADDKVLDTPHLIENANVSLLKNILDNIKNNKIYHNKDARVDIVDPETKEPIIDEKTGKPMKFVNNPNAKFLEQEKITEEVMKDMRYQLEGVGLNLEGQNEADLEKLKEAIKTDKLINDLEDEIESIGGIESIEGNKQLQDIMDKYDKSLSFLDKFMTPAQKDAIRRIREFTED